MRGDILAARFKWWGNVRLRRLLLLLKHCGLIADGQTGAINSLGIRPSLGLAPVIGVPGWIGSPL
jgi:hypothetical protein